MDRRTNNSLSGRRRCEEPSIYQLQPPPIPQPQQIYVISQHQQQPPPPQQQQQQQQQPSSYDSTRHSAAHHRDLRELAHKLGVKNGGHPPGWVEPRRNKVKYNNCGSTSNATKKKSRQLGIKLVQRGFKFSEPQRERLNEAFSVNRYPKPDEMEILAYEINVRKDQIKNWFHDQRRKYKKETATVKKVRKKPMLSVQQRKKLEEFFEKNFHPYPGDSRRLVEDLESRDDRFQLGYESNSSRNGANHDGKSAQSRGFKFSEDQRTRLRSFFNCNKYPNPNEMEQLAYELGVKREQVKNWFHDQRRKLKRENSGL